MNKRFAWYLGYLFSRKIVEVIFFKDIHPKADIRCDSSFEIRDLKKEDIPYLMDFHDSHCVKWNHLFTSEEATCRLLKDHKCYIALSDRTIVGFLWIGIDSVFSPDLNCFFLADQHSIIAYNAFVHPDYRGKNILPCLRNAAFEFFIKKGRSHCFEYLSIKNKAVKNSGKKFNFRICGKIRYGYILGIYYFRTTLPNGQGLEVQSSKNPLEFYQKFSLKR